MTIVQILSLIAVWCGNPTSMLKDGMMVRDDAEINECRAEIISCLEDEKVIPDGVGQKAAKAKLLMCMKKNNIR